MYGQTTTLSNGVKLAARKPKRWMRNSDIMLQQLSLRCDGSHKNGPLLERRAHAAEPYPIDLVKAIVRGMHFTAVAQRAVDDNLDKEYDCTLSLLLLMMPKRMSTKMTFRTCMS